MKHKTSELAGALLDAAVAKAEGSLFQLKAVMSADYRSRFDACLIAEHGAQWSRRTTDYKFFHPSTRWEHGGPIIERERISIHHDEDDYSTADEPWCAECGVFWAIGPAPLIAAMRAYVASKLGEEVEL